MTNKELAAALRLCGGTRTVEECRDGCPFYVVPDATVCVPKMTAACADALENHERHVAALQKEIETLRAQLTTVQSQNEQLREAAALTVKATTDRLCREWVSVEERLPNLPNSNYCETIVLVCDSGMVTPLIYLRKVKRGKVVEQWENMYGGVYDTPGTITHWMPLPEPPKEKA